MANIIKMGDLYIDKKEKAICSRYSGGEISIGPGNNINWVDVNGLLIADRCILTNISWDQLNAQGFVEGKKVTVDGMDFSCRLLKVGNKEGVPNEWDIALDITNESDELWHWNDMYFWGQETVNDQRTVRGYSGARDRNAASDDGYVNVGFRPALEPMDSAKLLTVSNVNFQMLRKICDLRTKLLVKVKSGKLPFLDLCCQYAHATNIVKKEAMAQVIHQLEG